MKFRFIILFVLIISNSFAQRLKIAVFYNQHISSCILSVYIGSYKIFSDTNYITTIHQNETFFITAMGDSVELKNVAGRIGYYKKLQFVGNEINNILKYKPTRPSLGQRFYDDDMLVSASKGLLFFINQVDIEDYICGVVESESGYQPAIEFYKTQAILCRTFALENIGKHYTEGFHLCDGVHCQAYKGKNYSLSYHSIIAQAVNDTKDLIIVDSENNVITATYHANCGGQTMNSEDVWGRAKYYLRSVNDSFCQYQRNTTWEKKIPITDFKTFLRTNKFSELSIQSDLSFNQAFRKAYYKINNDSVSLRKIRESFNLKSSFFSIKPDGDSLIFKGKGYGHGVGLCQDGAIQMAKKGYSYADIITFYFKGVRVVSYKSLPFYQSILGE
ncbi:MAG: SpoIID/LytB domain-containing protein [Bacteroidales bacterium]|nr:SpoIID/LytB domain-containing protein [Bacteroidales bacterium]